MVIFEGIIFKFKQKGEKTGWTYIDVPLYLANEIKPGNRREIRVRGRLDNLPVSGMVLFPIGEGNFILTLNAALRKRLGKSEGAMIHVELEEDVDFKIEVPEDLYECLCDEPEAIQHFETFNKSNQNYFINWINSAKTEPTRAKRIAKTVSAMLNKWDFGLMMRDGKPRE
ncbi:YdeI/OmpD-associated family protein [Solitalea sp. MAHUQ-68]|uniref:YdeI/OmpD-associated family protein n=1 Tax=Solitalea agri TaxID=2953739 RepID=A0A9X2F5J5_9SPHI|nr:YdeI/OmpD-associated family protein [Solitalea agri]MCO4294574.1 YdeI/OmpD-associated family protein [Solitalea agri]